MPRLKNAKPICPHCQTLLDGYTHPTSEDLTPQPGDLTVCANCSTVLEFTEDLRLKCSSAEHITQRNMLELSQAHAVVKKFRELYWGK